MTNEQIRIEQSDDGYLITELSSGQCFRAEKRLKLVEIESDVRRAKDFDQLLTLICFRVFALVFVEPNKS